MKTIETNIGVRNRRLDGARFRKSVRAALPTTTFASTLLFFQTAEAQDSSKDQVPGDIVVTAQKGDESVREVRQPLIAIKGETLARQGIQRLEDLTAQFPGVSSYSFGGAGQTQINIRCISVGLDTAATIATYVDDIRFGSGSAYSGLSQIGLELGSQTGSGLIGLANPGSLAKNTVTTYLSTVRYHFSGENLIYARAASGYRPGGPNLVVFDPATGQSLGATGFKNDTLWNYEVGVKLRPLQWLTTDVSAFRIDWNDIQLPKIVNVIGVFANGGTARSEGVEFAVTTRPIRAWTTTLSGAWTKARLTEAAPDVGGAAGERLPNSPRWSLNASTDYVVFDNGSLSGSVGAGWKYVSARTASFNGSGSAPQYVLPQFNTVDLRASLGSKHWDVSFYVRNLFDTRGQLRRPPTSRSPAAPHA